MFIYLIYYHNWRNISTIYVYNKTGIKRNILTIKQNTSGSRSGSGPISTPVNDAISVRAGMDAVLALLPESKPVVQSETCSSTDWIVQDQQVHLKQSWTTVYTPACFVLFTRRRFTSISFLISHVCMNESRKVSKVTDQRFLSTDHQLYAIGRHSIDTPINPAGIS
jgi:hypothetical protein